MEDLKISILAFNYGHAGRYVNGPGIDLVNFCDILCKRGVYITLICEIDVFYKFNRKIKFVNIRNKKQALKEVRSSDLVHYWSGNKDVYLEIISEHKNIVIGPNVLDSTNEDLGERITYLFPNAKYIGAHDDISNKMFNLHKIKFKTLPIGPNFNLWKPQKKERFILWKGNSKHKVKDVDFGLKLQKMLPEYTFIFLGYPKPYDYLKHIKLARQAYLFVGTSDSETKCNALLEQWACKTPSVTNYGMKELGVHLKTGLVCEKNLESYCRSIRFIMENENLAKKMQEESFKYVSNKYSEKNTYNKYIEIIGE
jgi:hypothetical protein